MSRPNWSVYLDKARREANLSQQELANKSGLSRSVIQRALEGGPIETDTLEALCRALGLDLKLEEK